MKYSVYLVVAVLLCSTSLAREILTKSIQSPIKISQTLDTVISVKRKPKDSEIRINQARSPICGVGPNSSLGLRSKRIANGTAALPNSWPSMVRVTCQLRCEKSMACMFCAGTLLDNYHILTAAHCFKPTTVPANVKVYLGLHTITGERQPNERLNISSFKVHELYGKKTGNDNDVAIIKMAKPVEFTDKVSPACLPTGKYTTQNFNNVNVTVIGWGYTDDRKCSFPDVLQQVDLATLPNNNCGKYERREITDEMLCATSDGKDSCTGDSGGPMFYQPSPGSPWIQIGIVSWARTYCGGGEYPGVYARVTSYLDWIEKTIAELA